MVKITTPALALLFLVAAPASVLACDPAHTRLLKRGVEAQEDQVRTLQRQEREMRAQTKLLDRQQRNQR